MSQSVSPTQSTSALPHRRSRQASSSAFSPTGSTFPRNESFAMSMPMANGTSTGAGMSIYGSPSIGQGLPGRRQYDSLSMSIRQTSSASISVAGTGTSTPDYKRRAKRMVERGLIKEHEVDRDWGNIEPDEVFRRLPVGEVRKVEAKMRAEALGKQAELRSMVGDLLTSATQITALHNSSIRLSRQLRDIADISSNPDTVAITTETSSVTSDTDDVLARLPAAAHMKLLLDATEALYVYLGNHEYLPAAYLWLVARVTKEGLSRMTDEAGSTYQPLLQKQWETLLPFRSQIVQQATESLRVRDASDIKHLSETILAIILLDNVAVPDAMSVLLEQRTTALRSLLAHSTALPNGGRKRSNSKISRSDKEQITSTLRTAVQSLLATVASARAIFGKSDTESLIERLIRLVQIDSAVPTITAPAPLRRTSSNTSATHHRRASRLVSISLPPAKAGSVTGEGEGEKEVAPISTTDIISALPSAQILLRHLPPAVLTYTPFLTPPSDAKVDEQLGKWTEAAIGVLQEATPRWLVDLTSAQAVWEVRIAMAALLHRDEEQKGELEQRIEETMEAQCVERVKGVWEADLGDLVQTAAKQVESGVLKITSEGTEADLNPEQHLFSTTAFPSLSSTLNTPSITVPSFVAGLRKRSAYRTPILDGILSTLEKAVAAIKADRQGLPEGVCEAYDTMTRGTLENLVSTLQGQLEIASRVEGEKQMYGELLVGRVALFMATASPLLGDLVHSVDTSKTIEQLISLHTSSLASWQAHSVQSAISHLSPLFGPDQPDEVDDQWQAPLPLGPSAELLQSLYSLVGSTRALGLPTGVERPAVRDLISTYSEQVDKLDGWQEMKGTRAAQGAVDLGWVNVVAGKQSKDGLAQDLLDRTHKYLQDSLSASIDTIIADSLRRTQLLLQPILVLVSPDMAVFTAANDSAQSQSASAGTARGGGAKWLRFGPPANTLAFPKLPLLEEDDAVDVDIGHGNKEEANGTQGNGEDAPKAVKTPRTRIREISDFRSPVAVAKPGKRFNLLSITS